MESINRGPQRSRRPFALSYFLAFKATPPSSSLSSSFFFFYLKRRMRDKAPNCGWASYDVAEHFQGLMKWTSARFVRVVPFVAANAASKSVGCCQIADRQRNTPGINCSQSVVLTSSYI